MDFGNNILEWAGNAIVLALSFVMYVLSGVLGGVLDLLGAWDNLEFNLF